MRKEDLVAFLIRASIPEVRNKRSLPPGMEKSDLVWDAIWRAHRDTLTGFTYKAGCFYSNRKDGDGGRETASAANPIAVRLYELISEKKARGALGSRELIVALHEEFKEPTEEELAGEDAPKESMKDATTFGAIQKLVNMTLKYLLILQEFGCFDECLVDEAKCDCPLDSKILKSMGLGESDKWTRLDKDRYDDIQNTIHSEVKISYDFEHWPSVDDEVRKRITMP